MSLLMSSGLYGRYFAISQLKETNERPEGGEKIERTRRQILAIAQRRQDTASPAGYLVMGYSFVVYSSGG